MSLDFDLIHDSILHLRRPSPQYMAHILYRAQYGDKAARAEIAAMSPESVMPHLWTPERLDVYMDIVGFPYPELARRLQPQEEEFLYEAVRLGHTALVETIASEMGDDDFDHMPLGLNTEILPTLRLHLAAPDPDTLAVVAREFPLEDPAEAFEDICVHRPLEMVQALVEAYGRDAIVQSESIDRLLDAIVLSGSMDKLRYFEAIDDDAIFRARHISLAYGSGSRIMVREVETRMKRLPTRVGSVVLRSGNKALVQRAYHRYRLKISEVFNPRVSEAVESRNVQIVRMLHPQPNSYVGIRPIRNFDVYREILSLIGLPATLVPWQYDWPFRYPAEEEQQMKAIVYDILRTAPMTIIQRIDVIARSGDPVAIQMMASTFPGSHEDLELAPFRVQNYLTAIRMIGDRLGDA